MPIYKFTDQQLEQAKSDPRFRLAVQTALRFLGLKEKYNPYENPKLHLFKHYPALRAAFTTYALVKIFMPDQPVYVLLAQDGKYPTLASNRSVDLAHDWIYDVYLQTLPAAEAENFLVGRAKIILESEMADWITNVISESIAPNISRSAIKHVVDSLYGRLRLYNTIQDAEANYEIIRRSGDRETLSALNEQILNLKRLYFDETGKVFPRY